MRVLVTGAGGNLGERLCARLETFPGIELWRTYHRLPERPPERALRLDLEDPASVQAAVARAAPHRIFHLAAFVDVQASFQNPLRPYDVNLKGTLALLEELRRLPAPPRLLYVSTSHVYGAPRDPAENLTEEELPRPVSPYAASKLAAEQAATLYSRVFGIEGLIARPFNLLGPGQPGSSVASALARKVAELARTGSSAPLRVGNVDSARDFVTVEDALDALVTIMEKGLAAETYNICTGRETTVRWIIERLMQKAGLEVALETDPALLRPVDPPRVVGAPDKLTAHTGFRAERPLEPALEALYEDWRWRLAQEK